jgi:drug/metabolite transporter (DMT)-like permease
MTSNRTMEALALAAVSAVLIGFGDNLVRPIAETTGLWQLQLVRSTIVAVLVVAVAALRGMALRPLRWRGVAARSAVQAVALLIYFGCLSFMTVAQAAAGLFTAPIFVLLIGRVAYGHPLGPVRIGAVVVGFLGVLLVLAPGSEAPLSPAALLPLAAGALYALSNIATREWCRGESATVLMLGFFVALGLAGLAGLGLLALLPPMAAPGPAGFVLRGWVTPDATFLLLATVQAVGAALGVVLMVRAYQVAEANRVSVFEYLVLPSAAFWGFVLYDQRIGLAAVLGMALIFAAGVAIALRSR